MNVDSLTVSLKKGLQTWVLMSNLPQQPLWNCCAHVAFGVARCGLSGGRQTPWQPTWSWMWTRVSRSTEIVNFISMWSFVFFLSHHWFDSICSSLSIFPVTGIFSKDTYSEFCLQDALAEKICRIHVLSSGTENMSNTLVSVSWYTWGLAVS